MGRDANPAPTALEGFPFAPKAPCGDSVAGLVVGGAIALRHGAIGTGGMASLDRRNGSVRVHAVGVRF